MNQMRMNGFRKKCVLFCLLLAIMFVTSACKEDRISPMNPHVSGKKGPFFDGWYYRLTDPTTNTKIAVIFASYLHTGQQYEPGLKMPGYLALLVSKNGISKTIELFPEQTQLLKNGQPVNDHFAFEAPADFAWTCQYGSVTQDSIDINVPGSYSLHATLKNRIPWCDTSELGPMGEMMFMRAVKLFWYVYSLGSDVSYNLNMIQDGSSETFQGSGYMHQENNWGATFPSGWVWMEGISEDNSAHIALTGGELPAGPFYLTTWLAGYHSKTLKWDFNVAKELPMFAKPAGTIIQTKIDSCAGTFNFSAVNSKQKLIVDASAPVKSFFPVSIPMIDGFKQNGGLESFDATIIVSAYNNQVNPTLIEKTIFKGAALEFGAGTMCK